MRTEIVRMPEELTFNENITRIISNSMLKILTIFSQFNKGFVRPYIYNCKKMIQSISKYPFIYRFITVAT